MSDYRNISIRNKRATYDFEILDTYIAGIVLTGTEIKSLRLGKASLTDCYCYFHNGEALRTWHEHRRIPLGHLQQPHTQTRP